MTRVVTVNDSLDGHVGLDLECFDRIYLNVWGPNLQVPGQVVGLPDRAPGFPIPSRKNAEKDARILTVLRQDGTFEYEHTYGDDPYPPVG